MRIPLYLMRDQGTLEAFLGDSAYGPTYGSPKSIRCRMTPPRTQNGVTKDQQGKEKIADNVIAFFSPGIDIPKKSRVTVNGKTYLVKDAAPHIGLVPSHQEVLLGAT